MKKLPGYHLYALLRGLSLGLSLPTSVTFIFENGCSPLHIGLLGTVMEISKLTFELPTGKLADKYGEKIPLILSGLLGTVLWLGYPLFPGTLAVYYGCTILLGISESMVTGSLELWFSKHVDKDNITRCLLNNTRIMIMASIIAGFASGWLYKTSAFYCFVTISLINLIKAVIPLSVKFKNYQPQKAQEEVNPHITFRKSLVSCTKYIWSLPELRGMLFSSFLVTMACDMVMRYYQPYLLTYDIKVEYTGYIFSFAAILAWLVITLGASYEKVVNRSPLLTISIIDMLGVLLCSILVMTKYGKIIILTLSLLLSIEDMRSPVVRGFISKMAYGFRYKAMLFSFYAVIESAGEILAGILFGWAVEYYGLKNGFIVSIFLFAISALCCMIFRLNNKNKQRQECAVL
jgi:MFS family permease